MELAEQRYQHWCAQKTLDPELRQELAAMQNDADKITDAFYRDLEFGTAGLRGVLGVITAVSYFMSRILCPVCDVIILYEQ